MKNQITKKQASVLVVLKKEDLTSTEILKRTNNIPHILKLYTVLDQLRTKGLVRSYIKENIKFHTAA